MLIESEGQRMIRSRSVVSRVIAGETLIVPVRGKVGDLASIYSFNATGTFIWQALDSPSTLPDLVAAIQSEFEIDAQHARHDVMEFLNEMCAAGLVEVCSAPINAAGSVWKGADLVVPLEAQST